MSPRTHQDMSFAEPLICGSADETVPDSETLRSPHLLQTAMKRDVSKSFLHSCSYLGKRRKRTHPPSELSIECPYPNLAPRDYTSRSWSNVDSPHPILPAPLPSPALDETGHALELAQKPLPVAELANRVNVRLRRLFGNRRGSAGDGDLPLTCSDTRHLRTSPTFGGPADAPGTEYDQEYLMWNGSCQLPNVSEFFDANGEVGPSSFYHTADWNAFQKTLQTQVDSAMQTHLGNPLGSAGDMDLDGLDWLRGHGAQGPECEARKRKDSLFSLGDFLRSRRSSKMDKGKGRMVVDDDAATIQHDEAAPLPTTKASPGVTITCLAEIGVLPRVSTETAPPLSPTEPQDVPQAEFSSLESSTPSWRHSASSTSPSVDVSVPAPTHSKGGSASSSSPAQPSHRNTSGLDPTTPSTPCILPTTVSPSPPPPSSSVSPLTTMQSLNLGSPQHTAGNNNSSHVDEKSSAEGKRASSHLGVRKSLEDKCWWDGKGEGAAQRES